MSTNMVKRWIVYLNDNFQPAVRIVLCIFMYVATISLVQINLPTGAIKIGLEALVVIGTCYLFFLLGRVCDEFKDRDVDLKYFPDRALPSGRVKEVDLKILLIIVVLLLVLINTVWPVAVISFWIAFIFFLAMAKFFFLEKYIANNRILAVLTHSPAVIIINLYIIQQYLQIRDLTFLEWDNVKIAVWFWSPSVAWEFARKVRAPQDEVPGYQTYSSMLGHKIAGVIPIIFIILQFVTLFLFFPKYNWSPLFIAIYLLLCLLFIAFCLRYIYAPSSKSARLQPIGDVYFILSIMILITEVAVKRGFIWT